MTSSAKWIVLLCGAVLAAGCSPSDELDVLIVEQGLTTTVFPTADAYVRSGRYADRNFGSADLLPVDSSEQRTELRTVLLFDLTSIASFSSARLRVNVSNGSTDSARIFTSSQTGWSERSVTWNNQPTADAQVAALGATTGGTVSVDLTGVAAPGRRLALVLMAASSDRFVIRSRETATAGQRPALILQSEEAPPPSSGDTVAPVVNITSPATGTSFTAAQTVSIAASATDNVGVTRVELRDGSVLKATLSSAPYTFGWAVTSADNGTHTWTATAYDAAGNRTASTPVSLTVNIATSSPPPGVVEVKVAGKNLVDQTGRVLQLRGVNRSGTQYACVEGWGFSDGPTDQASIDAMKAWGINSVRVSLNEHCWLGINGAPAAYSGASYRSFIVAFVNRLVSNGLIVILDLHWNAPGTALATDQLAMPDRDHAPAFWSSVGQTFLGNRSVIFDLYNEPHPDSNRNTTAAWACVKNGGSCAGVPFIAAGMQELVDAVRATGNSQPLLIGGPQYAGMVDQWLAYKPADPANQLVASIHIYYENQASPEWAPCYLQSCWDSSMAPLAASVPIIIGEFGEHDCDSALVLPLLNWADSQNISYLAWSWIAGNCAGEPALITDFTGAPSAYGAGVRQHLLSRVGH
jgi:endoglucanase